MHSYELARSVFSKCKYPLSETLTRLQLLLTCPRYATSKEGQAAEAKCKQLEIQIGEQIENAKSQNEQFNSIYNNYASKHRHS